MSEEDAMRKLIVIAIVSLGALLSGCVVVPPVKPGAPPVAAAPTEKSSCPGIIDWDAPMKYGYPDRWNREFREPPSIYPLYQCEWMQPLIEWARSASRNESERGGCTGGHTSFTCRSESGPSGTSRRGSEKEVRGGRLMIPTAYATLKGCPDAASERRELRVSIDRYGRWEFRARQVCYFRY